MRRLARTLMAAAFAVSLAGGSHAEDRQVAIFAGGCFWCVEADFDKVDGVLETLSGYTGGIEPNPSYAEVSAERTGHREAVRITFDAERVSYSELLHRFWRSIDPLDLSGQFCDRGRSYSPAVYVIGDEQRHDAEMSRQEAGQTLGQEISVPIEAAGTFWQAEVYHQDFASRNPVRYRFYRSTCGRDARIRQLWGDAAFPSPSG